MSGVKLTIIYATAGKVAFMMTWWLWMIVGLILMACEMLSPGTFYFIFLGVSAVLVGIAAVAAPVPEWLQWLLFSVFSAVSLLFFRRPLMQKFHLAGKHGQRVDSLVGETAIALDDIGVSAVGKAELRGSAWNARNVGDRPVTRAERCKVEQVDGLMLLIRNQ
jgi:membrane protein implicated in regulation of membrane protease activity